MVNKQEGEWVVPNPQIPRTFGILNIVFGGLLLLMGAGYLAFYIVSPAFSKQITAQIQQQQAAQKAERQAKIDELKKKEADATTKEEKADFQSQRETLELRVEPDLSDFADLTGFTIYSDRRLTVYYFTEVVVGILLNILMLISGIGLLSLRDWSRRLALGVACGKILRWIAMTVVTLVLILPITTQKMQKVFDKIDQQTKARGGAAAAVPLGTSMAQFTAISGAITMIFSVVVASIYPGISLWFLTRSRVRAACLAKPPKLPEYPGDRPGELA